MSNVLNQQDYGVVVQARMSSSRLPGKVLMDIEGQPMLLRQLRRLEKGLQIDKLIVATSDHKSDDLIHAVCQKYGFSCYRGPLDDVMLRYILLAQSFDLRYIIRVGGDDPLIDPMCCNTLFSSNQNSRYDFIYASNRDGWPYGCAAELIDCNILKQIHHDSLDQLYKEHIIPYFFDNRDHFNILRLQAPKYLNRPNYCFSVDYSEDIELVRTIFRHFINQVDTFTLKELIDFVDANPKTLDINKHLHSGFDH